jgi:hypothetical protein
MVIEPRLHSFCVSLTTMYNVRICRPTPRKQSAADMMALKIGLNVVPKRDKGHKK